MYPRKCLREIFPGDLHHFRFFQYNGAVIIIFILDQGRVPHKVTFAEQVGDIFLSIFMHFKSFDLPFHQVIEETGSLAFLVQVLLLAEGEHFILFRQLADQSGILYIPDELAHTLYGGGIRDRGQRLSSILPQWH